MITTSPEELAHMGRQLRAEPINTSMDGVITRLCAGQMAYVALEPGDATHYDLLLAWGAPLNEGLNFDPEDARDAILAVRMLGGHPSAIGTVVAWELDGYAPGVAALSNGNEWTAKLLSWWFGLVFARLHATSPGGV